MHCISLAFASVIFIGGIVGWVVDRAPSTEKGPSQSMAFDREVKPLRPSTYYSAIAICCANEHRSQVKALVQPALNNSVSTQRLHEVLETCINSTASHSPRSWCTYIRFLISRDYHHRPSLIGRKPVIRLRSANNQIISDVNVSLELDSHVWKFTSLYPVPSVTDGKHFAQWHHLSVDPNGAILFQGNRNNWALPDRVYPLINDENKYRMLFWEALLTSSSRELLQKGQLCVPRHDFSRILNYLLKKMTFSSEDRDSLITFVLPQLDEADPAYSKENVRFHFLSHEFYSESARLTIRPAPQYLVRAYLVFELANNDYPLATMDQLENEVNQISSTDTRSNTGLIVHEWGSIFIH